MQSVLKDNKNRQPKRFKVGIVGADINQAKALERIFTVTQYRIRAYQSVQLDPSQPSAKREVDFVLMCSTDAGVINLWSRQADDDRHSARPLIVLSPANAPVRAKYQINSPVNPGKLLKMLDDYTIKELNFFPEFEIGHESKEIDRAAAQGINALRNREPRTNARREGLRALVVDDSLAVRKQMQIQFELMNCAVDLLENAESAMLAVRKRRYDIIFLDVVMPGMDGYVACKHIRRSAFNRDTPVIMLTSRSSSFDRIKGALAGCSAYLVKPINHNEFDAVFRQYTSDSQSRSN